MYSLHSTLLQSSGPSIRSSPEAPQNIGARSPVIVDDEHRDDEVVVLSEHGSSSDEEGSDGSWEEVASQRDGWTSPSMRH